MNPPPRPLASLLLALASAACSGSPTALPRLATVPRFELVDQTGTRRTTDALRGKVWIADFFFTRCPTVCPRLTAKMAEIRDRTADLGDRLRLVSFTVDPEHDTPAVLAVYARAHTLGPRWLLLTGTFAALRATIVEGLKVDMGREGEAPLDDAELAGVFHGTHLVLVDRRLVIRGYYRPDDRDVVERIARDAEALALGERSDRR